MTLTHVENGVERLHKQDSWKMVNNYNGSGLCCCDTVYCEDFGCVNIRHLKLFVQKFLTPELLSTWAGCNSFCLHYPHINIQASEY